jgi:hypothetical protein
MPLGFKSMYIINIHHFVVHFNACYLLLDIVVEMSCVQ